MIEWVGDEGGDVLYEVGCMFVFIGTGVWHNLLHIKKWWVSVAFGLVGGKKGRPVCNRDKRISVCLVSIM